MQFHLGRRVDFDARLQAKLESICAQQAEFAAGMVEIRELLGQMAESGARMENSLRHIRGRGSEQE